MLICSCRHVPTSTTTAWKKFAIPATSPMRQMDNRRRYDTWAEAWAHNMVVYASNSVVSQCFVGTYQALCSLAPVSPTAAILATTLGLRLVTFPLYAYSEKLASKRLIAMNVIQHQVCEKVGKHYGVKPVVDERTEQLTLDTGDKLILDNYRQLTNQTVQTYTTERRLRFERIFFLKLSPVYFWLCASMGLRMHVAEIVADGSPPLSGFLWLSSVGAPDPYMVLPLCFGALSLLNIWSTKWMFTVPGAKRRWTGHLIDGLMIMGAGVGVRLLSTMPAMQSIYWCIVLSTTLSQTLLLRHPTVKRWLRIDRLPTDSATPFRDLFRFRRKKLPLRTF